MNKYQHIQNLKLAAEGVVLLAVFFIAACGQAGAVPTPVAEVESTSLPTATLAPSDTPSPHPSPTSTPTGTPSPKATPLPITPTATETVSPPAPTLTSTATSSPTLLPASPIPTRQSGSALAVQAPPPVEVYETTITLPTYPFRDYLIEQMDPVYNLPVFYFNRPVYEAANPPPTPVEYQGIVLENAYLRLTFLPELGGRLYSAVIKATGQEVFYHNQVVKPSRYGILYPVEANWWLATGGMEWAYPTQEHGYRWGVAWDYEVSYEEPGATITLSDTGPGRVGVVVKVTLPADSPIFTVAPKLTNDSPQTVPVQFWLNAALALAPDTMSTQTQFILPSPQMLVHSRGPIGWQVPPARTTSSWPQVGEVDLTDYNQWTDYLGFFVFDPTPPFMGAYNPRQNLGVVRLIEPGTPGNKLFAFGQDFKDRSYTDNGSQYFEIWGGINTGFWPEDDVPVAPGESLQWQEQWWPQAGLGGLTWATAEAAINLSQRSSDYQLAAFLAKPTKGTVTVLQEGTLLFSKPFLADPATPLFWKFEAEGKPIEIVLVDDAGSILLNYQQ